MRIIWQRFSITLMLPEVRKKFSFYIIDTVRLTLLIFSKTDSLP